MNLLLSIPKLTPESMNVLFVIFGTTSTILVGITAFFMRQTYLKFNALTEMVNQLIVSDGVSKTTIENLRERIQNNETRLNHHSDRFAEYDRSITEFYKTYELKRKD